MRNIFCCNLPFTMTDQDLDEVFSAYGQVDRIHIPTDRETGKPRGFAFVEMRDDAAADDAICGLNGSRIGGRTVVVNEARPREANGRARDWRRDRVREPRW